MRRVSVRLMPFLFVLYIFNFLDRTNVGLAALQMNDELGFSSAAFGFGAGVFFIGYSLFEVPSNLLLIRVGARRWIARIMISWGFLAAAMMFVRTPEQFYVMRFLLGVAEAGFFPAILYYLSQWYPAAMRARSLAWFMIAIPLSGALGGPLGTWLLGFHGAGGLSGWQWLFLVEGIPSVLLGFVVLRYLTERPEEAHWLPAPQRAWLIERLARDRDGSAAAHGLPPLRALAHPLIWLAAIPELLVTTAGYAYVFWGPTLMKESLQLTVMQMGWLITAVAILCAIALILVGMSSDRRGERVLHAAACAMVVSIACLGAALLPDPTAKMGCLVVMQVAVIAFLAPFWTLPTILLSGSSAAVGIALVNSIGNVGGFIGPTLIGFLKDTTGHDNGAFYTLSAMAFVASLICVSMRWSPSIRESRGT
ncbi:MAG: MFS transporter [Cytophagaceae bacterium]|nr:MFS transporter [Gemmatimonadaceae bacterium]